MKISYEECMKDRIEKKISVEIRPEQIVVNAPGVNYSLKIDGTSVGIGFNGKLRSVFSVGQRVDTKEDPNFEKRYDRHIFANPFPINPETLFCLEALTRYYFALASAEIEKKSGRFETQFWGINGNLIIDPSLLADLDLRRFERRIYSFLPLFNLKINGSAPPVLKRFLYILVASIGLKF